MEANEDKFMKKKKKSFTSFTVESILSTNKNDVRNQSSSQANPQASSSLASTFPHFYPYYADLQTTLVLNPFTGYWERILIPQNQFHCSWYKHQWDLNPQPGCSNPVSSIVSETNRKKDEIPTTTTETLKKKSVKLSDDKKGKRTIFTLKQIKELEDIYKSKKYLTKLERAELSEKLNTDPLTIRVWFQNKRTRSKIPSSKPSRASLDEPTLSSTSK